MTAPGAPDADGAAAGDALPVDDSLAIPRSELLYRASRSGGPGGQHVNTSSTRIELLWNIRESRALGDAMRVRLLEKLGSRLDGEGTLRVVASDRRSQLQNREAAEERLAEVVRKALAVPKPRKKTKPSRAARAARLDAKRRQGERKKSRRRDFND